MNSKTTDVVALAIFAAALANLSPADRATLRDYGRKRISAHTAARALQDQTLVRASMYWLHHDASYVPTTTGLADAMAAVLAAEEDAL